MKIMLVITPYYSGNIYVFDEDQIQLATEVGVGLGEYGTNIKPSRAIKFDNIEEAKQHFSNEKVNGALSKLSADEIRTLREHFKNE